MKEIDFLPTKYREKNVVRKVQLWRLAVVVALGGTIAAAAIFQVGVRRRVEHELSLVQTQHLTAEAKMQRLALLQERLHNARAAARLYTYLRHPWPTTQLLAAVVTPLPDTMALTEVHITHEASSSTAARRANRQTTKEQEQRLARMLPAERDLERLREEFDNGRTIIEIKGTTRAAAALHRYLAQLGRSPLLEKVELGDVEDLGDGRQNGAARFEAHVTVRPSYGQPCGPAEMDDPASPKNRIARQRSPR